MTIGTAIVLSIAILCVTFLGVMGIGAWLALKQKKHANDVAKQILEAKKRQ